MPKLVLAGDVGGTNSRLALFELAETGAGARVPAPEIVERFPSRDPGGLAAIVRRFLAEKRVRPDAACFGVAGPVVDGRVKAPNLPFVIDAGELTLAIGAPVTLLNDLEAAAYGVPHLQPSQLRTLQSGTPDARGTIALIAAGTGLGEASLVRFGAASVALPSEGGHADFAPVDEDQAGLLLFLLREFGRASYERVLSGAGLANIYRYYAPSAPAPEPAEISRRALEGTDPVALRALRTFVSIYGSEAGNHALRTLCFGGLFMTGGIGPKVIRVLEEGGFVAAFRAKGRASQIVERIPIHVAIDEVGPLLGAASIAAARM